MLTAFNKMFFTFFFLNFAWYSFKKILHQISRPMRIVAPFPWFLPFFFIKSLIFLFVFVWGGGRIFSVFFSAIKGQIWEGPKKFWKRRVSNYYFYLLFVAVIFCLRSKRGMGIIKIKYIFKKKKRFRFFAVLKKWLGSKKTISVDGSIFIVLGEQKWKGPK